MSSRFHRNAGVGLVSAIFLLVVLAGLGAAAVSLFGSQQAGAALDEQGARAYQAARAGIEWGLFQRLQNGSTCATFSSDKGLGQGTLTTFAMPTGTSLSGFTVTVECMGIVSSYDADLTQYRITAIACNQPGANGCPNQSSNADYVQRRLEVQL